MKKWIFSILLPLSAFAQEGKEFKVKGELKLARPVEWVYLRYGSGDKMRFDSLRPAGNEFKFEGQITEPSPAMLMVKYLPVEGEDKPKRENITLFLEPGKLELTSMDSLQNTSVKGSMAHDHYVKLKAMIKRYEDQLSKMYKNYSELAKQDKKEDLAKLEAEIEILEGEMKENGYARFAHEYPSSPIALYAVRQYAGWDIDPVKVAPLFESLPEETRQWPSAISLSEQIEIAKKTAIGVQAMEFTQNDTLGKPVSLSSFRGKYVLVDFWASWCGPCRRENPNLVKAFQTFKDRNFTVLGVSLDRPDAKEKWMAAIHKDNLTWTQVSDLKFWENEVAKLYGIRAIPQNLLIDPKGTIIAKNVTGEKLVKVLAEVLPK